MTTDHRRGHIVTVLAKAKVVRRHALRDGRRLALVVCPTCETDHWFAAEAREATCPTTNGTFTLEAIAKTP
jgi:hypothetical protein